jgi:outer membrane beta-barrel protein
MESRFRVLFLTGCVLTLSGCAATKNLFGIDDDEAPPPASEPPGQVVDPQVERREIKEPAIDREDFEIGVFGGIMSVEDFGSDPIYGIRLAYHLTEGFFVEASAATTEAGLTSFEELSGDVRFFEDRRLNYYNLNLGYNLLPGEVFVGGRRAYNANFYVVAGLGSTSFAEDDRFTVNFGAGFRFLWTDSLALHVDFRDHLFDIDVVGREKTTHNLEGTIGVSFFF